MSIELSRDALPNEAIELAGEPEVPKFQRPDNAF
jgi:hypothetical protein